ncbi:hypothetical protein X975_03472, partial [Stegodyphus mimosarum]
MDEIINGPNGDKNENVFNQDNNSSSKCPPTTNIALLVKSLKSALEEVEFSNSNGNLDTNGSIDKDTLFFLFKWLRRE